MFEEWKTKTISDAQKKRKRRRNKMAFNYFRNHYLHFLSLLLSDRGKEGGGTGGGRV